jgi:hypothetical protein
MGYEHMVDKPSFWSKDGDKGVNCNAVFSHCPSQKHKALANSTVTLDSDRKDYHPGAGTVGCTRNAAIAAFSIEEGEIASSMIPVTIACVHLDVLAECGTYLGFAVGGFVRFVELENWVYVVRDLPSVTVVEDCNAPAKSTTRCTSLTHRLDKLLEQFSQA